MIREIADRLDMDLEIADYGLPGAFRRHQSSGRIDVAISTITITNERLENQAFTQGYYDADLSLVTSVQGRLAGTGRNARASRSAPSRRRPASAGSTQNTEEYGFGENAHLSDQQGTAAGRAAPAGIAGAIGDVTGFVFAAQEMPDLHIAEVIPPATATG
jgi:polar amino acid transport system substrate-binding protein